MMNILVSFDLCKIKFDMIKEVKWKIEMLRYRGKE